MVAKDATALALGYAHHMQRARVYQDRGMRAEATHHMHKAHAHLRFGAFDLNSEDLRYPVTADALPSDYVDPTPHVLDMRALVDLSDAPVPDMLVFHSASAGAPPGKGTLERVAVAAKYGLLSRIADWRKMLSNFDAYEFSWDGRDVLQHAFPPGTRWPTIEHAFHASKYQVAASLCEMRDRTARAEMLRGVAATLTSASTPPVRTGAEAKKRGREVRLESDELRTWAGLSRLVMASIARAKFFGALRDHTPSGDARVEALLATNDAQLWHFLQRKKAGENLDRFEHLEEIRRDLREHARVG